jgi:hypothetical protein
MSQHASTAFLRTAVLERRFTRFRKTFTRDLTLTAKYNDALGDGDDDSDSEAAGWRTDELSSDGPNENKSSNPGIGRGGQVSSKDTWRVIRETRGNAIMT